MIQFREVFKQPSPRKLYVVQLDEEIHEHTGSEFKAELLEPANADLEENKVAQKWKFYCIPFIYKDSSRASALRHF
jgi:hypothetical protein